MQISTPCSQLQQISKLFQQFPEQKVATNMYHMTNYLSASTFNIIGKFPIVRGTLTIYLIMYASIAIDG